MRHILGVSVQSMLVAFIFVRATNGMATDWPMSQMNPERRAVIPAQVSLPLRLRWRHCNPVRFHPSISYWRLFARLPMVAPRKLGDKLYVLSRPGTGLELKILDTQSGNLQDTVAVGKRCVGVPDLVVGERGLCMAYLLGDGQGGYWKNLELACLDANSLEVRWQKDIPGYYPSGVSEYSIHMIQEGRRIFVSLLGSDHPSKLTVRTQIAAVDVGNGDLLWKTFLPETLWPNPNMKLSSTAGKLVVSISDKGRAALLMIDEESGGVRKFYELEDDTHNPISSTGETFFVSEHNEHTSARKGEWIYKFDKAGKLLNLKHLTEMVDGMVLSPVVQAYGAVFFACGEQMCCFSDDLRRLVWNTKVKNPAQGLYWSPIRSEPILFGSYVIMFCDSNLLLFDAATGKIAYRYDLSKERRSILVESYGHEINEVIASESTVYIASSDGCIYALGN